MEESICNTLFEITMNNVIKFISWVERVEKGKKKTTKEKVEGVRRLGVRGWRRVTDDRKKDRILHTYDAKD